MPAPVTDNRDLRSKLLSLAIPVSLEAILQSSLGFIDQVVVGHLGESPLAAAGLTNNVMFLLTMLVGAIAASASILVAQHHGRGDGEGVARVTAGAIVSAVVVAVPPTLLTTIFPGEVLHLLGAAPDVVDNGRQFFRVISLTLPLSLLSAVAVGVLRSLGDVRTPMVVTLISMLINTVLSMVLVFGWGPFPALGVVGAATATLISQVIRLGLLAYTLLVRRQASAPFAVSLSGVDRRVLGPLFTIAYPIMLNDVLWGLGNFSHTLICVQVGTVAVASTQMVGAALGIVNTVPSGLSVAGLTLVGQEIGAGDTGKVKDSAREVVRLGVYVAVIFGALLAALSLVERRFYPNVGDEVIRGAGLGLVVNGVLYGGMVMNIVLGNGILRAGGDTRFVLMASLASVYAVGVPLTLALVFWFKLGLWGVFLGRGAEEVSRALILLSRYRTPRWYQGAIEPEGAAPKPTLEDLQES